MKSKRRTCVFLLLSSLLFLAARNSGISHAMEVEEDTIEENPNYVAPAEPTDDESSDDGESATENEKDIEEAVGAAVTSKEKTTKKTKSLLSKALSRTEQTRAIKLMKKHRASIALALLVFAFRRELGRVLYRLVAAPVYDPQTGKQTGHRARLNPTSILKLLFFFHFTWRSFRQAEAGGAGSPSDGMLPDRAASVFFPSFKHAVAVPPTEQHWTFERLNERYEKDGMALLKAMGESPPVKQGTTTSTTKPPMSIASLLRDVFLRGADSTVTKDYNGTVIVVDMTKLSTTVTQMELIRDQVSFLISQHQANQTRLDERASETNNSTVEAELEVVILLESPGGGVSDYGLASSQLMRLKKEAGIRLTVCVDKVAASGGYMMAAVADTILAAPFAMVGSIGVYGQAINIHDVLDGWGVKDLIFRAGKNKAPLGLIGEVTQAGRDNIQSMIDDTHVAFKYHVSSARPALQGAIDEVATGDVWLGCNAVERGLVDRLVTSDEYLGERMKQGARVLKLIKYKKPSFGFGPPSPYSMVRGLVQSVTTQIKDALIAASSIEEDRTITARSISTQTVQTRSPIS